MIIVIIMTTSHLPLAKFTASVDNWSSDLHLISNNIDVSFIVVILIKFLSMKYSVIIIIIIT